MGHNLELFAGPPAALEKLRLIAPGCRMFVLRPRSPVAVVPLYLSDADMFDAHLGDVIQDEQMRLASAGSALAYLHTDYFGGRGSQVASLWVDGRIVFLREEHRSFGDGPVDSQEERALPLADRPINRALRGLGVVNEDLDEFETFGLGDYRENQDIAATAEEIRPTT